MDMNRNARAAALAAVREWHEGQRYGSEDYVDGPLLPVAVAAERKALRWTQDVDELADAYLVGLLHDTIEDGAASAIDIIRLLKPIIGSMRAVDVADAVDTLARKSDETYAEYIARLPEASPNVKEIVLEVKIADLAFNLAGGAKGLDSLRKRYEKAWSALDVHL